MAIEKGVAAGHTGEELGVSEAVRFVRSAGGEAPEIALILGSGLGALADAVGDASVLDTAGIPGYPRGAVEGHLGRLVFGILEGKKVMVVQGRVHVYEGHSAYAVAFPIRLAYALGARRLLVTNAAGGINRSFAPGTLMFITDHINWTFENPRIGQNLRPPAHVHPVFYDPEWIERAEQVAAAAGIRTRRGVYLWTKGPGYETKAEIRAFTRMGADAVGMSTVPEVIQASVLGMKVLGISTITNPAAGLGAEPLVHEDVLAVGKRMRGDLERLIRGIVAQF